MKVMRGVEIPHLRVSLLNLEGFLHGPPLILAESCVLTSGNQLQHPDLRQFYICDCAGVGVDIANCQLSNFDLHIF